MGSSVVPFRVSVITQEDIDDLALIENTCFDDPWSQSVLAKSIDHPRQLVLGLYKTTLVGFAIFSSVLDESELLQIAVVPELRGKGLAKGLLDAALKQLHDQGITKVMLEVRKGNGAAVALYERCGFKHDGVRKGYYPPRTSTSEREDALLMSASIIYSPE